jgi:hypothetical protein
MANYDWKQIKEGSVVYIRTNFGSGPTVKGTVVAVEEEIKNGQPGIDYNDSEGGSWWAYKDQIAGVYRY